MNKYEASLDRFYSAGDPQGFQDRIADLAKERLEAELLDNRIRLAEGKIEAPVRRRRSPASLVLLLTACLMALGGVVFLAINSSRSLQKLALSATILHSTEGKLIEALAYKAENNKEYVEKILATYRKRIEERKAEPASLTSAELTAAKELAADAAERQVQRLVEERVNTAIGKANVAFASGNASAAVRGLEQLLAVVEGSPQKPYVEAMALAYKEAEAAVRDSREAVEKAERRLAAAPPPEAPSISQRAEAESGAEAAAERLRLAASGELVRVQRRYHDEQVQLASFIRRLAMAEVWDMDAASAAAARVSDAVPGVSDLPQAIVALADHVARARPAAGSLRFLGTVSMVLGQRVLADIAATGAVVGGRVRIYHPGSPGNQGKELAQATIAEIHGNTATLRISTPADGKSATELGIALLDTVYFQD